MDPTSIVILCVKTRYAHPESGPLWDRKMRKDMKTCGYLPLEDSPGLFYNPTDDTEVVVYVDDLS